MTPVYLQNRNTDIENRLLVAMGWAEERDRVGVWGEQMQTGFMD